MVGKMLKLYDTYPEAVRERLRDEITIYDSTYNMYRNMKVFMPPQVWEK